MPYYLKKDEHCDSSKLTKRDRRKKRKLLKKQKRELAEQSEKRPNLFNFLVYDRSRLLRLFLACVAVFLLHIGWHLILVLYPDCFFSQFVNDYFFDVIAMAERRGRYPLVECIIPSLVLATLGFHKGMFSLPCNNKFSVILYPLFIASLYVCHVFIKHPGIDPVGGFLPNIFFSFWALGFAFGAVEIVYDGLQFIKGKITGLEKEKQVVADE